MRNKPGRTTGSSGALKNLSVVGRIDRVGSVGSKLRNKRLSWPCCPPTPRPYYTPRGLLLPWGVGPLAPPLFGPLVLLLNSHLGASTTLAPLFRPREVHLAPLRGTRPPRWGSHLLRAGTPRLAVPLRGSTKELRSPPPGHPGQVRAYGSLWVYDPRHSCVPCTLCAHQRLHAPHSPCRRDSGRRSCDRGAPGQRPHPVPPHRRPASPALPESQAVCALPSLRPGATHRGNSVGRVGRVGSKLRNKHLSLPCCTPLTALTTHRGVYSPGGWAH